MRDYAADFSKEETNRTFISISKEILPLLLKKRLIPRKLKIVFDFHKDLYYGKKDNHHAIGIKVEKGTEKAHMWHTCAIILNGRKLQIESEMVKKDDKPGMFLQKMIEFLE